MNRQQKTFWLNTLYKAINNPGGKMLVIETISGISRFLEILPKGRLLKRDGNIFSIRTPKEPSTIEILDMDSLKGLKGKEYNLVIIDEIVSEKAIINMIK